MAMALRSSSRPPALALSDRLGLGRFRVGPLSAVCSVTGSLNFRKIRGTKDLPLSGRTTPGLKERRRCLGIITCAGSNENQEEPPSPSEQSSKASFGYSRKDVILIGLGVSALGVGLKIGLEYSGVDPLRAGNYVQVIVVLGMIVGWISTYVFRVANKDMTYAKQLRDYEKKVMEKRLESLSEAELEALMEQVEEEKRQLASGERPKSSS